MVIELASTLKKKIIADGVETPVESAKLNEFGCDMVQGYLFSKPLPMSVPPETLAGKQVCERRLVEA